MTNHLRIDTGVRNRLITGSPAMLDPESINYDTGWLQLSWNWLNVGTGVAAGATTGATTEIAAGGWRSVALLGNTSLDRLYITFEKDRWRVQAGRQRINWGQTFVWNPNDIFNTYSFFDFDYPERPGCDALRIMYYHNETSSSELAVSLNRNNKATAAMLHRWNRSGIDYQLIMGEQAESDLLLGGALTGDIKGLNFRSEISYFHPIKNLTDTSGIVAVSAGIDYIFSNSLMLQTEVLYSNANSSSSSNSSNSSSSNSSNTNYNSAAVGSGLMGLYSAPLSAKYLSICNWNIFAQASYPITPRLNGSLSGIYFIDIDSCYTGLSLDYSVAGNLDFSLIAQYFSSFGNSEIGKVRVFLGFARLKYAF